MPEGGVRVKKSVKPIRWGVPARSSVLLLFSLAHKPVQWRFPERLRSEAFAK